MRCWHATAQGLGGDPETGGRKKIGAFLIQNQLQTSAYSSALFLTSGAQNLLCINLAAKLGAVVPDVWMNWFIGCLPQAVLGMVITPLLLFKQYPPEVKETPEAPGQASERLKKMGPMSRNELITTAAICGAVVLWIMGDAWGVPAVLAAMLGLAALLVTGVLSWRDCLEYPPAWDCLTWFAVLVSMSSALNDTGLITTFADIVGKQLTSLNLGWQPVFFLLHTAFFFIHYLFAGQTAHVGALFTAFLAMMLASGVPSMLAVLSLGYNTNLFGNITHYASGQAAIYFGNDYVTLPEWFSLGFIYGALSLVVVIGLGYPWWRFLGWC
ncbi:2-oxoglutarate/malate translocator Flags: Precursor [Monoraphidium neglectum]|uniref:2-oxoglutarate/malate translocator n=1 Tax=Monoraphidium neglectum TaxID=145388 RepID=A0A0D2KUX4_9CHLO|nr:2-oxoglutarate/malate translocator Flags: Precursor [Monoraphidium neglectum]KIY99148.1 2-oxoglutarate/malate translocator Flags: Precursor [Monoraphidium neglectum]|eukprot:XP_013898168.1 2-oxoglutarate/malate translocator Flags: Precursor [Monoraphidium neglectum]